jgi:hypothetical protein
MKPEPPTTEHDFGKDLKTFEHLPVKTKELLLLQDQMEKSTGQENNDLNKVIRDKSQRGAPSKPTKLN